VGRGRCFVLHSLHQIPHGHRQFYETLRVFVVFFLILGFCRCGSIGASAAPVTPSRPRHLEYGRPTPARSLARPHAFHTLSDGEIDIAETASRYERKQKLLLKKKASRKYVTRVGAPWRSVAPAFAVHVHRSPITTMITLFLFRRPVYIVRRHAHPDDERR